MYYLNRSKSYTRAYCISGSKRDPIIDFFRFAPTISPVNVYYLISFFSFPICFRITFNSFDIPVGTVQSFSSSDESNSLDTHSESYASSSDAKFALFCFFFIFCCFFTDFFRSSFIPQATLFVRTFVKSEAFEFLLKSAFKF